MNCDVNGIFNVIFDLDLTSGVNWNVEVRFNHN